MRSRSAKRRARSVVAIVALTALLIMPASAPGNSAISPDTNKQRAVAHRANGKVVRTAAARSAAPKPRMFRLKHGAGEPTLGITNLGHVFVTASDGCVTSCAGSTEALDTVAPGGRSVYRSGDGGLSWDDVTPRLGPLQAHALSMDPYVYVDEATSRVFNVDLTVACSYLSYSDDEGESWITNPAACGEPVNDHQTVFAGPPAESTTIGYENVVYYCYNHPAFTKCSKSLDGGITWITSPDPLGPDCGGLNGHGVVGSEGTVYLPLATSCAQPILAISDDEAATWRTVRVADLSAADSDPSVALDDAGNIYYLFIEGQTRLPHLVVSRDQGETWSKPVMVAAPGVRATNLATLDVGDPGKVAIAYYGTETTRGTNTWNGYLAIGKGTLGKNPLFYSASINDRRNPLKVNACGPGRCGRVLDFIDVEIGRNGQAWGAYVDACQRECEKTLQESIHDNEGVVGTFIGGFKLR